MANTPHTHPSSKEKEFLIPLVRAYLIFKIQISSHGNNFSRAIPGNTMKRMTRIKMKYILNINQIKYNKHADHSQVLKQM